jgi:hypothetical protein
MLHACGTLVCTVSTATARAQTAAAALHTAQLGGTQVSYYEHFYTCEYAYRYVYMCGTLVLRQAASYCAHRE